jgi:hypothetical protein
MPTIFGSGTTALTLTPNHRIVTLTGTITATGPAGTYGNGSLTAAIFGPDGKPFTLTNDGTIDSPGASVQDTGILLAAGTLINNGAIAAATGIFIEGPARITNRGAVDASIGNAIEIWSRAAVTNTGTLTAAADGILLAVPGTILNAGLIAAGADGIYLGASFNARDGVIENQSTIAAGQDGVFMRGPDNLYNYGLITGADGVVAGRVGAGAFNAGGQIINYATIQGATYGVFAAYTEVTNRHHATIAGGQTGLFLGADYSLQNQGLITGAQYAVFDGGAEPIRNTGTIASAGGTAILDRAGGRVVNTGLISGSLGINLRLSPGLAESGTIVNDGTILGTQAAIYAGANATITNRGAIIGQSGAALYFAPGPNNRLILTPSATIAGAITLNGGTLELASGRKTGTISLDTISAAALVIDQAADWDLAGTTSLAAALTNNGTITESAADDLTLTQPLTGRGTIVLNSASLTVESTIAGQKLLFTGTADALSLTDPADFAAKIAHFTTADTILLPSLSLAALVSETYAHDILTLAATTGTYALTFASPHFHHDTIAITADGLGIAITLAPKPQFLTPAAVPAPVQTSPALITALHPTQTAAPLTSQYPGWLTHDLLKPVSFLPTLTTF